MKQLLNVIVDTSPVLYAATNFELTRDISEAINEISSEHVRKVNKSIQQGFEWINSGAWLHKSVKAPNLRILWVGDSKPYWRSVKYPAYKSGRKPKSALFKQANEAMEKLLGDRLVTVKGFEADDLAAYYAQNSGEADHTLLVTLDTDWFQLVSPPVTVYSTYGNHGVVRAERVTEWLDHKYKKMSGKAKQRLELYRGEDQYLTECHRGIVAYKRAVGDSSDNLPIGCDRSLVDLLSYRTEFDIQDHAAYLNRCLLTKSFFQDDITERSRVHRESHIDGLFRPVPALP